jgi:hypothetical protein
MKKLIILAVFALSMFASTNYQSSDPVPECNPCPWVR